jgi:hypothetical protein
LATDFLLEAMLAGCDCMMQLAIVSTCVGISGLAENAEKSARPGSYRFL